MSRDRGDAESRIATPLRLGPTLDPKPWGGRRLAAFGKTLPDGPVGESLESGDGATIDGGPFAGQTLGALARAMPDALLGSRGAEAAADHNDFPLLVKLIDAREDLSIQVHPPDTHAPPGKRGKTEAWLILESDADGSLVTGVSGSIDAENIGQQIVRESVRPGDIFFVPAGTVHAIGAGVVLYEVQQASDVTYRLFDWGRPRELHLASGIAVARPNQCARRIAPVRLDDWRELLVACRHFQLERWSIDCVRAIPTNGASFRILTVIAGALSVDGLDVAAGTTVVLPADLADPTLDGDAVVLVASIPDLFVDVISPLRRAGVSDEVIRQLGIESP